MQVRRGRNGDFYGCGHFPKCKITFPLGLSGIHCPRCGAPVVERRAKTTGRAFWPCSRRECDFVSWHKPHLCGHGSACFGAEEAKPSRRAPDAVPDPAIPERQDADLPF